jgi:hypothetical protein
MDFMCSLYLKRFSTNAHNSTSASTTASGSGGGGGGGDTPSNVFFGPNTKKEASDILNTSNSLKGTHFCKKLSFGKTRKTSFFGKKSGPRF